MTTPRSIELQIVLEGHFDATWSEVFDGLSMVLLESGETRITGEIDQARLHGLFRVFRDRGIAVKSVNPLGIVQED